MNDVDKKINSLEVMMKTLIIGEDAEIDLLCDRFLQLNNQTAIIINKRLYLSEVYNIAYTIRIFIRSVMTSIMIDHPI